MLKNSPGDWLTDPNALSVEDHNAIVEAFGKAFAADKANRVVEDGPTDEVQEDPEELKRTLLASDAGVPSMITD